MGRLTELFNYLNREEHPTSGQIKYLYNYITINEHTKKLRRAYRGIILVKKGEDRNIKYKRIS